MVRQRGEMASRVSRRQPARIERARIGRSFRRSPECVQQMRSLLEQGRFKGRRALTLSSIKGGPCRSGLSGTFSFATMSQDAVSAKPLSRAERTAHFERLVRAGKLTRRQASLIDLRELTPPERQTAETLRGRAARAPARGKAKAA